jgi:Fur family ferric uptake transcriptional regulator
MAQQPGTTVWTEHAHRELARAGHRAGGAREEVLALLARQDCCLTAQEIHDRLRRRGKAVGRRAPPPRDLR